MDQRDGDVGAGGPIDADAVCQPGQEGAKAGAAVVRFVEGGVEREHLVLERARGGGVDAALGDGLDGEAFGVGEVERCGESGPGGGFDFREDRPPELVFGADRDQALAGAGLGADATTCLPNSRSRCTSGE